MDTPYIDVRSVNSVNNYSCSFVYFAVRALAEVKGFEPLDRERSPVFKTGALILSATLPIREL